MTVEGDLAEDARRRIERALLAAVRRAIATVGTTAEAKPAGSDAAGSRRDERDAAEIGEPVDPNRIDAAGGSYQLPSYQDRGRLSGVKLLADLPEARPGFMVHDGPSPLDGALIISLPGTRYVNLSSPRYASAGTLTEALLLGEDIFGTSSFALVQGPMASTGMRYLAIGTAKAVAKEDLGTRSEAEVPKELLGRAYALADERMQRVLTASEGKYLVRGFVTSDRGVQWPDVEMAALWFAQLDTERAKGVQPQPEVYRVLVFDHIDALVEQFEAGDDSQLRQVAEALSRLDEHAFGLVDWETRVRYLKVLLAAEAQGSSSATEKAVVAIFRSLENDSQVDAVVALLKVAGCYEQLFDMDSQLYELLTVVGGKFPRDHGPLTLEGLIALFESLGLLPRTAAAAVTGLKEGADGTIVPPDLIVEARQAVMGFVGFAADLGESVQTIFTEPDKLVRGIGALVQLVLQVELAIYGYGPAATELGRLLAKLGEKLLSGMRGADRLGAGEKVVRRVRWRLVWEIASLFVGVAEVKAAIQAVGAAGKLAGVLRFLGILARLGEAADAEVTGVRLARLAGLLEAERAAFASVDEVAELLSHLPEDDVRRLGRLLSTTEIEEGETLADLAARNSELHAAAQDAVTKAELLKTIAAKAGGLSEEIAGAFRALIGRNGLELAVAQRVVRAIPEGEGARFAATLRRVPMGRLAADRRTLLLEMLASSPRRMDAVARLGFETFGSVWRRTGGGFEAIDGYVTVLEEMERRFAAEGRQAEYRRLLDGLELNDPAAWLEVETEHRVQKGQAAISGWLAVAKGSPRAQAGLDRLLRGGHDNVVSNMLVREYENVVRGQLEQIAELTEHQVDGLAAVKRIEVDLNGDIGGQWLEVLDLPSRFRDPMLDLVADIERSVDGGLDLAIKRAVTGNRHDIQGTLGHLFAARTLRNRFPGARLTFELPAARREIDIQLSFMGRKIDVEVKTNLALEPSVNNAQIYEDLGRHMGDHWDDMLYLYAPQQAGNTAAVERAMLRSLERLHREGKLPVGMTLPQAQSLLEARMNAPTPWKLVDVFAY